LTFPRGEQRSFRQRRKHLIGVLYDQKTKTQENDAEETPVEKKQGVRGETL